MATKWKRYKCTECSKIIVTWKLRKINGKRKCATCIDLLHEATKPYYQKPPNKKLILEKANLTQVQKKKTSYNTLGK